MTIKKLSKKILIIAFIAAIGFTPFINITPQAQTAAEIQQEIDDQKAALEATKNDIDFLQSQITDSQNGLANAEDGLPKLQAQLESNQKELELNEKQLALLKQENKLKESIKQQLLIQQQGALDSAYQQWRIKKDNFVTSANMDDPRMNNMGTFLASKVLGFSDDGIKTVAGQIDVLNNQITASETAVGSLENKKQELANKKKELEDAIAYYNSTIQVSSTYIANLETDILKIQNSMSSLSANLSAALLLEAQLANEGGTGGASVAGCGIYDDNNSDNNFTICGLGDDFVQGHGVGMSQWGAYGGAQNGMSAQDILRFYYTGVDIVNYSLSSEISIKFCPNNPVMDAYQNGCDGGESPVTERVSFDSYLAGLGEMPHDWPLEARKAQIIAARSYAVNYTENGNSNYPICITAWCQVSYIKSGSTIENDAVQSTKDLVITHSGQIIQAMYSADNSQGWGTADYETMFQDNYDGSSTYYPYLRAVNDSAFAVPTPWSHNRDWGYKTNTYSMNDINTMLDYVVNNSGTFGGFSNYAQNIKNKGRVTILDFERDSSLRVKKVWLKTADGNMSEMGAYWFTFMWNIYISRNSIYNSNGSKDWLWSQTFFLHIE